MRPSPSAASFLFPYIIRIVMLQSLLLTFPLFSIAQNLPTGESPSGPIVLETGHSAQVQALAFSHDGRWLASGGKDENIKIWDVDRRRVVRTLTGHIKEIKCLAFSPIANLLASSGEDGTIRLWDGDNSWTPTILSGTGITIFSLVFSPDGTQVISGDLNGLIKVRDIETGREILSLRDQGVVMALATDPVNQSLLAAGTGLGGDDAVHLWDITSGKEVRKLSGYNRGVSQVSFSPDGRTIAVASPNEGFEIRDVNSGKELLTVRSGYSTSVAFMRNGKILTSALLKVSVLDISSGVEVGSIDNVDGYQLALSPDQKTLATAGILSSEVKFWDVASKSELPLVSLARDSIVGLAVSSSGRFLASFNGHLLEVWNLLDGGVRVLPVDPILGIADAEFSPDEKSLVVWGYSDEFMVWDVGTAQKRFTAKGHKGKVNSVVFRPDGRVLASAGEDGTIRIWSASTGGLLRTVLAYKRSADSVAYTTNGERLVSSGAERKEEMPQNVDGIYTIKLWDPATGRLLRKLPNEGALDPHQGLTVSSTGTRYGLFGLSDVWLLDAKTGRKALDFNEHEGYVTCIGFSPDGQSIAAGSEDHTVKLWDTASGDELVTLVGHTGSINGLAFGPDRKWLATSADDGTIRVWDISTGATLAVLVSFRGGRDWIRITGDHFDGTIGGEGQISLEQANPSNEALKKLRDPKAFWSALSARASWNSTGHEPNAALVVRLEALGGTESTEVKQRRLKLRILVAGGTNAVREVQLLQNGAPVRIWSRDLKFDHEGSIDLQEVVFLENGKNRFGAVVIGSFGRRNTAKELDLKADSLAPEITVQVGNASQVYDVKFSPKEPLIAAGGGDRAIVLWDPVLRRQLRRLVGHSGIVNRLAFSPDGRLLASASSDKTVMVWEVATGRRLRTLSGHGGSVFAVAFSPNGKLLATGSEDTTVGLWDVMSGREIRSLEGHTGFVSQVGFNPDGTVLASAGLDKTIRLWDVATGRHLHTLTGHSMPVAALAFSPDGHVLVSGAQFGTIKFWDVATGKNLRTWERALKFDVADERKPFLLDDIVFSPSGRWVVTAEGLGLDQSIPIWYGVDDTPGAIRIFDSNTGHEIRKMAYKVGVGLKGLSFSANGKWLGWGDGLGGVQLTAVGAKWGTIERLSGQSPPVRALDVSPTGTKLATGGGGIHLWDLASGRPSAFLHAGSTDSAVAFGKGDRLASQAENGPIYLWALGSNKRRKLGDVTPDTGSRPAIKFTPDGRFLASGASDDVAIHLWETSTGRHVQTFGGMERHELLRTIDFSSDGRLLVSAGTSGRGAILTEWDVTSGKELRTYVMEGLSSVNCAVLSPDAKSVATADLYGALDIWDLTSGKRRQIALKGSGSVAALAFSPDGRWLASGGDDSSIRIWQVDNGKLVHTMNGHESLVSALAFFPSEMWVHSHVLVSGGADATVRLWDADSGELLATLLSMGSGLDWLVMTPDGLFDGSPAGWSQVLWRFGGKTRDIEPVEIFFSEFFHPGLLAELVEGRRPKASISLKDIDRRQPKIELYTSGAGSPTRSSQQLKHQPAN